MTNRVLHLDVSSKLFVAEIGDELTDEQAEQEAQQIANCLDYRVYLVYQNMPGTPLKSFHPEAFNGALK